MRTFQHFALSANGALVGVVTMSLATATLVANEEWRVGFGFPSVAGTAPPEGVWFILDSAGLRGVQTYNSVTTQTAQLATLASFTLATNYTLKVVVNARGVTEFYRDEVLLGTLAVPVANGQPWQQVSLPLFMQKLCTGVVANTNVIRVFDITAYQTDSVINMPFALQQVVSGQHGNIGQNGHTPGKNSSYANNAAPTAVALTNTTAAFVGLGGQAAILPTLAVSTDGIIFSYQNPAPTVNIPGKNLLIYGVKVQGLVSVALTGGPLYYQYTLAYGHTSVSLATAETASFVNGTTHAPRILAIGFETYVAAAIVGTLGQGTSLSLQVPVVVRPGEFVQLCAKAGVGSVVTTLGAITIMATFDSVWA